MAQATTPTFGTNNLVGVRGQFDYLEIAIKPASGDTVVFERIPLLSDLGAFTPTTQDAELPLFVGANGVQETLRASRKTGGSIAFSTAGHLDNATVAKLIAAANAGTPIVYRAFYKSMAGMIQGRGSLADRGMAGGANDIPQWNFEVLASTAEYVNANTNEVIG